MKQIISFKKDIPFNTRIDEVTSISLEHSLKMLGNDHVAGEFVVSGTYKMTEASIYQEPFSHTLPFDITLDTKYNIEKAKLDIDDFYYEIINDQVLSVNIDVLIDNIEVQEEKLIESESEGMKEKMIDDLEVETQKLESEEEDREVINLFKEIESPAMDIVIEDKAKAVPAPDFKSNIVTDEKIKSLFDSFDDSAETFTTYHVHIVRESDTIDSIIEKYSTSKEEIAAYNKIDELKLGDKIIIPASNE